MMSKLLKTMPDQTFLATTALHSAPRYLFARRPDGGIEYFGRIGEPAKVECILPPLRRVDRSAQLPLSFVWQRIWVLNQLDPHDSGYNVKTAIRALIRLIYGLNGALYKVVVLDCDNTLWSGICDEDGPLAVVIDGPRRALQQFMLKQRERGVLLCLCSKSSEKDVWEVFEQNQGMLLRREDISGYRINGEPKPRNLRALAQELGFGLDSFVFLGDSPMECAEVEAEIPEMLTLQVPEQVERLPAFLKNVSAFDHFGSTEVDRRSIDSYKDNQQREELRQGQSLGQITYRLHVAGLPKPIHELAGDV
jgi:HAD superfamily phosphatase (TIGR01681 family)